VCLFIKQIGGDGSYQEGESSIRQLFNIRLWITQKKPYRTNFFGKGFSDQIKMKDEFLRIVRVVDWGIWKETKDREITLSS
jgi:hypothetical protein